MRTGLGSDIHRLVTGRKLVLGGVTIDFELGLLGHSDADVVIHAMIDALLGAAGLGDIGELYPDTDLAYNDAASTTLLEDVVHRLRAEDLTINNIDIIINAQKPKLKSYKPVIRTTLAGILGVDADRVNVKAKTAEGLDAVGRGEAISAQAIATLNETT